MFGIGYQEMLMIALFALIIFGPGKLPEVMREAGKHYRKFKGMADEMTGELNKVTSEARKELDGALGDLGPMGKDLEKSLGMKGNTSTRSTSAGTGKTTTTGSKKSTSSSSKRSTSSSRSTSAGGKKKTSTTEKAAATSSRTPAKPAKPLVATKEDPLADFASFEVETKQARRRSRSATPTAITDLTPRDIFGDEEPQVAEKTPEPVKLDELDDPVARARARRRTAGYARA